MPTRPREYQSPCTVTGEVAYEVNEPYNKGTQSARGRLATGRVVWTSEPLSHERSNEVVSAYAEGIGVVSIGRDSLAPVSSQ